MNNQEDAVAKYYKDQLEKDKIDKAIADDHNKDVDEINSQEDAIAKYYENQLQKDRINAVNSAKNAIDMTKALVDGKALLKLDLTAYNELLDSNKEKVANIMISYRNQLGLYSNEENIKLVFDSIVNTINIKDKTDKIDEAIADEHNKDVDIINNQEDEVTKYYEYQLQKDKIDKATVDEHNKDVDTINNQEDAVIDYYKDLLEKDEKDRIDKINAINSAITPTDMTKAIVDGNDLLSLDLSIYNTLLDNNKEKVANIMLAYKKELGAYENAKSIKSIFNNAVISINKNNKIEKAVVDEHNKDVDTINNQEDAIAKYYEDQLQNDKINKAIVDEHNKDVDTINNQEDEVANYYKDQLQNDKINNAVVDENNKDVDTINQQEDAVADYYKDTTAPTYTVTSEAGKSTITLTFNEKVDLNKVDASTFTIKYDSDKDDTTNALTTLNATSIDKNADGKTITITCAVPEITIGKTAMVIASINDGQEVYDLAGNKAIHNVVNGNDMKLTKTK